MFAFEISRWPKFFKIAFELVIWAWKLAGAISMSHHCIPKIPLALERLSEVEFLGLLPPSGWGRHFSVFTLKFHFLPPCGASNQTIAAINSPMEYLSNSVDLLFATIHGLCTINETVY